MGAYDFPSVSIEEAADMQLECGRVALLGPSGRRAHSHLTLKASESCSTLQCLACRGVRAV